MSNKTLSTEILAQNASICNCRLTVGQNDLGCGVLHLSVKASKDLPLDYEAVLGVVKSLMDQAEQELHAEIKPATKQTTLEDHGEDYKGPDGSNVSEAVHWIFHCSVDDVNWDSAVTRLTDGGLYYCIRHENRTTGLRKLKAELKRRGLKEVPQ